MIEYHLLFSPSNEFYRDNTNYLFVQTPSYNCGNWSRTVFEAITSVHPDFNYNAEGSIGKAITDPRVVKGTKHRHIFTFPPDFDPSTITEAELNNRYPEFQI